MWEELNPLVIKTAGHDENANIDIWCVGGCVDYANFDNWDDDLDGLCDAAEAIDYCRDNTLSIHLPETQALILYRLDGEDRAVVVSREEYRNALS